MERSLLWSALALGCVGGLSGILLTRARRGAPSVTSEVARPFWVVAVAIPILVFLATLPSRPPFSEGQGFGRGFLLGAIGALLSAYVVMRSPRATWQPIAAAAAVTTPAWFAVALVAVPLLFMHNSLVDSLSGISLGWFAVTAVLIYGLLSRPAAEAGDRSSPVLALLAGTLFTIALCAVTTLGLYRAEASHEEYKWCTAALTVGAGVPLALLLAALPSALLLRLANKLPLSGVVGSAFSRFSPDEDARQAFGRFFRLVIAVAQVWLLTWLVGAKLLNEAALWKVGLVGLLGGVAAWWLVTESAREKVSTEFWVPLAVMLVVGGLIVAFRQLAGFGIGVMVLGAWLSAGMALIKEAETPMETVEGTSPRLHVSAPLLTLLSLGTVALLWRLVGTRFDNDLRGVVLSDYYAVFGFFVGALLPGLLAAIAAGPSTGTRPGRQLLYLVIAGALALAAPAILLTMWKSKVAIALLAGLAVATVQSLRRGEAGERVALGTSMFALAVGLAMSQWMHHALSLASLSRAEKTRALTWGIVAVVGLILAFDYGERFAHWRSSRRAKPTRTPATDGGVQQ